MTTCTNTFEITIQAAERITGLDEEIIRSANCTNRVHRARTAVFLVLNHRGWTAQRISKYFQSYTREHLDVSTVTHGLGRARKLHKQDASFQYLCEQIKAEVMTIRNATSTFALGLRYTR